MSATIAYLINQYPKVSHSFIRREIVGIEACGINVQRFSIRSCEAELVDEADKQELSKTDVLLNEGVWGLMLGVLSVALLHPIRWLQSLLLAFQFGRRSHNGWVKHLAYFAEACVLLNRCSKSEIRHIHVHFGTNSCTVAALCNALGGPSYSVTIHGPEEFDSPEALSLKQKIQRATFVVAVSSFGRSQLYRWCLPSQWKKIHVVHCGVDQLFLKQTFMPPPDQPRLICIGRLSEQKGHLLLIEAVAKLVGDGLQLQLSLVGDGPLRAEVEKLIARHGLQQCVEVTGWLSNAEICQRILDSKAMVLPSFAEGLPVVIMESLALGRPVISTYVAGIPELVKPDECGWLVPPGNVEELAIAIRNALQLPAEQLERMGKNGIERVEKSHDISTESSKLANLILFYLKQPSLEQASNPSSCISDLSKESFQKT